MTEMDDLLAQLRAVPGDDRLGRIDDAVLAGLADHRARVAGRRGLVLTGCLALGVGLMASVSLPQGARAEQVAPLIGIPEAAPSSLLMGTR